MSESSAAFSGARHAQPTNGGYAARNVSRPGGLAEPAVGKRLVDAVVSQVVPELVGRRLPRPSLQSERPLSQADLLQRHRIEEFVDLLFDETDNRCEAFIAGAVRRSADPQKVAAELLGPAARLVGDYWRMDVCDFMKVTIVMTRIQRLFWCMVTDYPPAHRSEPGRSALLSPVAGDQHSFGLNVVEDALRRAGWQVDSCGFDQERDLYRMVHDNDYCFVGLTMSGEIFAPALAATIRKLKQKSRNPSLKIMVGGSIFVDRPALAFDAGADFLALDAMSAVSLAELTVARGVAEAHMSVAAE